MIGFIWDRSIPVKLGLPHTKNHLIFSYCGNVFFSIACRGKAIDMHIAATREGKRHIRTAVNQFCQYVFFTYEWCDVIIANIFKDNKSVQNLALNCGFSQIGFIEGYSEVYALCRQ